MAAPFFPTPARSETRFENRVLARLMFMSDAERAGFLAAAAVMVTTCGLDGALSALKRAAEQLQHDDTDAMAQADMLETWLAVAAERLEDEA